MDDQDLAPTIFDRIDVIVAGVKLTARPTDFELDEEENPIRPIQYETTCPACGNAISWDGVNRDISCPHCGETKAEVAEDKVVIRHGVVTKKSSDVRTPRGCPFLDPVEMGTFKIEAHENNSG